MDIYLPLIPSTEIVDKSLWIGIDPNQKISYLDKITMTLKNNSNQYTSSTQVKVLIIIMPYTNIK